MRFPILVRWHLKFKIIQKFKFKLNQGTCFSSYHNSNHHLTTSFRMVNETQKNITTHILLNYLILFPRFHPHLVDNCHTDDSQYILLIYISWGLLWFKAHRASGNRKINYTSVFCWLTSGIIFSQPFRVHFTNTFPVKCGMKLFTHSQTSWLHHLSLGVVK